MYLLIKVECPLIGFLIGFIDQSRMSPYWLPSTSVTSLRHIQGSTAVYNLEIHGTHVYHVGSSGVLVHNGNLCFKVSTIADDFATKGMHIHVGGTELGVFVRDGALALDKVFSSTKDSVFNAAAKKVLEELISNPAARSKLSGEASRAIQYLEGFGPKHGLFEAAQSQIEKLRELIKVLEGMAK